MGLAGRGFSQLGLGALKEHQELEKASQKKHVLSWTGRGM